MVMITAEAPNAKILSRYFGTALHFLAIEDHGHVWVPELVIEWLQGRKWLTHQGCVEEELKFCIENSPTDLKIGDVSYKILIEEIRKLYSRPNILCVDPVPIVDTCELGHKFGKLPDHPKDKDGHVRCPHCLVQGLDIATKEVSRLEDVVLDQHDQLSRS